MQFVIVGCLEVVSNRFMWGRSRARADGSELTPRFRGEGVGLLLRPSTFNAARDHSSSRFKAPKVYSI
jgi:hypothetical protein